MKAFKKDKKHEKQTELMIAFLCFSAFIVIVTTVILYQSLASSISIILGK